MSSAAGDTSDASSSRRTGAHKIIWAQLAVTAAVSLGFGVFSGTTAGLAALTGGLINVVANLYFIRRWFATVGVASPTHRVLGFYVAEVAKLLITIVLLVLAIGVLKLPVIPLFIAFVATLLVFWLALSPRFWSLVGGRS